MLPVHVNPRLTKLSVRPMYICLTHLAYLETTYSFLLFLSFLFPQTPVLLIWQPWPLPPSSCFVGSSEWPARRSQRNRGPWTSSPPKVLTPLISSPSHHLLPCVPLARVNVWGAPTRRVLNLGGGIEGAWVHGVGCRGQTGSHTKGVDWCPGQELWGHTQEWERRM